jgi:hypothetical protein
VADLGADGLPGRGAGGDLVEPGRGGGA